VFDCRNWVPNELTLDGHHMSGRGADLFTEKLMRQAVASWLAGRRATP